MDKAVILRIGLCMTVGILCGALAGHFGKCSSGACPLTATPWRGAIYGAVMGLLFGLSFK
ncbi:DUF6132 family protein [Pontiellaceae bacterium B12227]|nr:DUF6132 family protein [Pontiellaceae bacterium B12227]